MKYVSILIFFLILFVLGFLFFKIVKFLFPFLLLLFIFFVIQALLKGKPEAPKPQAYQKEVIKDVEIRVVDETSQDDATTFSKENRNG